MKFYRYPFFTSPVPLSSQLAISRTEPSISIPHRFKLLVENKDTPVYLYEMGISVADKLHQFAHRFKLLLEDKKKPATLLKM